MTKKSKIENIIAFQGVHGAHSDLACRNAYPYMDTIACPTFEDVFRAVEEGKARLGMIPIENTHAGRVAEIHNILPHTKIHIVAEHFQPIKHQLLAPKGATVKGIKTVYSHPQALMQCTKNLNKMGIKDREAASNTAVAAEKVAQDGDLTQGAIASSLAGELYGLEVIKEDIEDAKDNTTIFIVISKEAAHPEPNDGEIITSILFTARNIPAALYKALGGFATNNVNLVKIESYIPGGVSTTAQFFINFHGHPSEKNVQLALEELGFFSAKVKVLGVYPADPIRFA